ncbi:MAG: site-specific integrase [Proteobacteria bacterium]|nr:site-specific integrase [Pseudomonadota bacterium]
MGSIYKRNNMFWIKYSQYGKPIRESAQTEKEGEARRLLKLREGQIQENKFPGLQVNRTRFDDLCNALITEYKIRGRKSVVRAELSVKHLKDFFGDCKAIDITTSRINQYITAKQTLGMKDASINRDLSALRRMFSIALQQTPPLVSGKPYIPMLREDNVRTGFYSHEEYLAILGWLPDYLKGVFTMGYYTGMRKGEILSLEWKQINLFDKTITLSPGTTKNGEGRILFLVGELLSMIQGQYQNANGVYVFHRDGQKIKDFRFVWSKAFKMAGIPEQRFHDLRRSAVRNMTRSGVSELVAMKISGHKTRAIFDRYNITDETDLRIASEKVSDFHKEHERLMGDIELGTIPGTIAISGYRRES